MLWTVHFDRKVFDNWSVDQTAKRIIAIAGICIMITGTVPLIQSVHGNPTPQSDLEWEVKHLREEMAEMRSVPTEIALIMAHQKIEDDRYEEEKQFRWKLFEALLSVGGGTFLALLGWLLHESGLAFGKRNKGEPI